MKVPNPSMATPIINVSHLIKRYADVTAVDDVSFSVMEGEIFGLLGPNGRGQDDNASKSSRPSIRPLPVRLPLMGLDVKDPSRRE